MAAVIEADAGAVQHSLCSVCQQQVHKYRCPGCHALICSLACSKQHKQATECSGKRDKLGFVALQNFTDRHLLSDYRWLEELSRAEDNARRHRPPTPRRELPQHLSSLVHQARLRGVRLLIMPPGMRRRQTNSTRYDFRARKLYWRIEWRFPGAAGAAEATQQSQKLFGFYADTQRKQQQQQPISSTQEADKQAAAPIVSAAVPAPQSGGAAAQLNVAGNSDQPSSAHAMFDGRVNEDTVLANVLAKHLEYRPGSGAQALLLREYRKAGLQALTVLMKKEKCAANAVKYYCMDLQQPLKSLLAGKTVIEYPTLVVLLPGEEASYNIISLEEQQAEGQWYMHRPQGRGPGQHPHIGLPPPPPAPRLAKQQQELQQQQQPQQDGQLHGQKQQLLLQQDPSFLQRHSSKQQQQQQLAAGPEQPLAKRHCSIGLASNGAAGDMRAQQEPQEHEQGQQLQEHHQQQLRAAGAHSEHVKKQQQAQELEQQKYQTPLVKYYYYDPADGADEDAADLLAGLEADEEEFEQPKQQQRHQVGADAASGLAVAGSATGRVMGGEDGRAAMMQLLGQYDENEIGIDD